jgi:AraC-like DNA-binding protein
MLCNGSTPRLDESMREDARSSSALRTSWLVAAIREVQICFGRVVGLDVTEAQNAVATLAHDLPPPATPVEILILRGVLLEFACRCGTFMHTRVHNERNLEHCSFNTGMLLDAFWSRTAVDPRAELVNWANAFFVAFARAHPPSVPAQVARVIRQEYEQPLTTTALAHRFNVSVPTLHRAFESEFAISIRDYQRVVRVIEAFDLIGTEKTESVAFDVGYKSKKNFYSALRQVTRLTPTGLRALSAARIADLIESLRLMLMPTSWQSALRQPVSKGAGLSP